MSLDLRPALDVTTMAPEDRAAPRGRRAPVRWPTAAVGRLPAGHRDPRAGRARRDGRGARAFRRLVATHQRRASRIAYQYLRDAAEADEAVQDAFVKVFSHISPIARRGRSKSGSRGFSSTAASIAARRGRAASAGSSPATRIERGRRSPRRRRPRRATPTRSSGCSRASAAPGSRRRSIGSTAGSGRCSCCATTAIARRAKSAP